MKVKLKSVMEGKKNTDQMRLNLSHYIMQKFEPIKLCLAIVEVLFLGYLTSGSFCIY